MHRPAATRTFHGLRGGNPKPDTARNMLIRDVIMPWEARFPRIGDGPAFAYGRVHSLRHYVCGVCAGDRQVTAQVMNQAPFLGEDDAA